MKNKAMKLLSSLFFSLIAGQGFADTLTVSPLDGNQQNIQYLYGNGEEQVPIKVTINYNKYEKNVNDQYFNNLQFYVGDIFTSKKMSDLNINDVCTDNPYYRISGPTGRGASLFDGIGVKFFNSNDFADPKFYLNKSANKWQDSSAGEGVSFCFTNKRNIFSLGAYNRKSYTTLSNTGVGCTTDGQEHCSISHVYLMKVDARDYSGGALGQSLIQAKTSLNNGSARIISGNANEDIYIDKLNTTINPVTINSTHVNTHADWGYIIKAAIDNVHATILASVAMVDDHTGAWGCASHYANPRFSGYTHLSAFLSSDILHSLYMHNSRTYHRYNQTVDCLFSVNNGEGYNLNSAEQFANDGDATATLTDYNLDSNYKPGLDSLLYLGSDHDDYNPYNFSFRFYILDEFGNFINTLYSPGH